MVKNKRAARAACTLEQLRAYLGKTTWKKITTFEGFWWRREYKYNSNYLLICIYFNGVRRSSSRNLLRQICKIKLDTIITKQSQLHKYLVSNDVSFGVAVVTAKAL